MLGTTDNDMAVSILNEWWEKLKKNEKKINIKRRDTCGYVCGRVWGCRGDRFPIRGSIGSPRGLSAPPVTLAQSSQEINVCVGGAMLPRRGVNRPDYIDSSTI